MIYALPKKDPYIVRIKPGQTLSTALKKTTDEQKNEIKSSAARFKKMNIRKGW